MTDEQVPDVEDVKVRLSKDEIPVEDETEFKAEEASPDIVEELRNLGRQFGETVRTAWSSEERRNFEQEVKKGVQTFAQEVDKAFKEAKDSKPVHKAKSGAADFKDKAASAEIGKKTQTGLAKGLRWFSDELAKLADNFTPVEKAPEDTAASEETEE
jgi:hypothetical protein